MQHKSLTVERLRQIAHYDPETGIFTRIGRTARKGRIGARMGTFAHGKYRRIAIDGALHYEHRLAWLYMTGEWPKGRLDHRDMDPSNNTWSNLREATHDQNLANTGPSKNNTSGFKGVHFYKKYQKYAAEITAYGKNYFLGYFECPEDASEAYAAKAGELFGEFAKIPCSP